MDMECPSIHGDSVSASVALALCWRCSCSSLRSEPSASLSGVPAGDGGIIMAGPARGGMDGVKVESLQCSTNGTSVHMVNSPKKRKNRSNMNEMPIGVMGISSLFRSKNEEPQSSNLCVALSPQHGCHAFATSCMVNFQLDACDSR